MRTRRAILDAARTVVDEKGLGAASQEAVARAAGISQSTLRHYFPTKDALQSAVFVPLITGWKQQIGEILLRPKQTPQQQIEGIVTHHLDGIASAADGFAFEGFAFLSRQPDDRNRRDSWYGWLYEHYVGLIHQSRPDLSDEECEARSFQILTLCLGAWFTLGRSRPHLNDASRDELKAVLLDQVQCIVGS